MTGLNIQFLAFFGDGVNIWQVFIRMLGYYGTKLAGSIVKIFPLLGEGLRERVYLEDRKVRSSEGRLFTVKGLFSNCRCLSSCSDITSSCKTQVVDGTATFPRNDIENLCKTQVSGAAATLPHRGEGISNYNQIIYNNQPSPQPSPTGEEVSNYKMLKQVQHDTNSSKRTYSPIHLFSYSPCKRCAFTLAEGATHVATSDNIRRAAFTLAEVLITLGIIGVVAAMTMPSLITNYQKQQTVVKLKATYSLLAQAVQLSEVDNGELEYWDFSLNSQDFFNKYFSKYLTFINTKVNDDNIDYYWLNGEKITGDFKEVVNTSYIGILNNGAKLFYHNAGELYTFTIIVDINGEARPNKVGRDVFHFSLSPKDGLRPWGYNNHNYSADGSQEDTNSNFGSNLDRDILTGNGLYACNKAARGRWCAALIMADGWEIKSDYPW